MDLIKAMPYSNLCCNIVNPDDHTIRNYVVLYVSCGLVVCYFTYSCGCIEHIRYYWKTWIEVSRQWLILTYKHTVHRLLALIFERQTTSLKKNVRNMFRPGKTSASTHYLLNKYQLDLVKDK